MVRSRSDAQHRSSPGPARQVARAEPPLHASTPVHAGVLVSLAAAATALLASAGVLVDRGALAAPLSPVPATLTIAVLTLGAGLAAITVSAAWQSRRSRDRSRDRCRDRCRVVRGATAGQAESAGSPAGPT